MRKNTIRETLLSQYAPSVPKVRVESLYKSYAPKAKGQTLEEFYREVHAKNSKNLELLYHNKNAKEIESMMIQNRKMIEHKRGFKK